MTSILALNQAILEQHEYCCGVLNEITHQLNKQGYKFNEKYVERYIRSTGKVFRKFNDALKNKIHEYYQEIPDNLNVILKEIRENTPFTPSVETIRRIMKQDLELKLIPRNLEEVRADRNIKPTKTIRRKKLSLEERRAYRYCSLK